MGMLNYIRSGRDLFYFLKAVDPNHPINGLALPLSNS